MGNFSKFPGFAQRVKLMRRFLNMRAFISIPTAQSLQTELGHLASRLPLYYQTPPQNLHLTLCFLDEIPEALVATAIQLLSDVANSHHIFHLQFTSLLQENDMAWLVPTASPELQSLYHDLWQEVTPKLQKAKPSRNFRPHIKLGKTQKLPSQALNQTLQLPVQEIALMKTLFLPGGGVKHEKLGSGFLLK